MKSPNPKISQYVVQFKALYDGKPWYGDSICKILENITPANAFWQPTESAHSIAQLTSHLIYWRQPLIKRLNGDLEFKASAKSEDNWKSNDQLKKEGWNSLKKSFDESQTQLVSKLEIQKDSILKKNYSDKVTFQDLINGILQHDLYHIGQIAYLKNIYLNKKE